MFEGFETIKTTEIFATTETIETNESVATVKEQPDK